MRAAREITDDGALMRPVSGVLWLAGAAVGAAGWLLPGSPHAHAGVVLDAAGRHRALRPPAA